jgi:hypothetical protein
MCKVYQINKKPKGKNIYEKNRDLQNLQRKD